MAKQRILITGGNGVLGSKLISEALRRDFEVYSCDIIQEPLNAFLGDFNYVKLDITKESQVERVFTDVKPNIVIHAAAFTQVDKAEESRELCREVNEDGSRFVARYSCKENARLVAVSTDYVFDGKEGPYSESAEVNPLGWYGKTKYFGEVALQEEFSDVLICRTMALYGFERHIKRFNFVGWLIDSLRQGKEVQVVVNQMANHTLADWFCKVLIDLSLLEEVKGVLHTAGEDWLSRYDFACQVADFFSWDRSLIKAVSSKDLGWTAARPLKGGLKMDRLHGLGLKMLDTKGQMEIVKETFSW